MSPSAELPPAGWYPDPAGSNDERYWDGDSWSKVTRSTGGLHPQTPQGQVTTQPAQTPHSGVLVLAGWWWRVLATIVDYFVLLVPLTLAQNMMLGTAADEVNAWVSELMSRAASGGTVPEVPRDVLVALLLNVLVSVVVWVCYRTLLVAKVGGTLGQLATGLRVTRYGDPLATPVGWRTAFIREGLAVVFLQLPILSVVNLLAPLVSGKKQTFHDMIAKTVVIKK